MSYQTHHEAMQEMLDLLDDQFTHSTDFFRKSGENYLETMSRYPLTSTGSVLWSSINVHNFADSYQCWLTGFL